MPKIICYRYKPLKDATYPLMLRMTKGRKRKYVSLGIYLDERFCDFEKSKPKRNCPNKEQIERLITAKTAEYNGLIVEMTTQQRDYTAETLVSHFRSQVQLNCPAQKNSRGSHDCLLSAEVALLKLLTQT